MKCRSSQSSLNFTPFSSVTHQNRSVRLENKNRWNWNFDKNMKKATKFETVDLITTTLRILYICKSFVGEGPSIRYILIPINGHQRIHFYFYFLNLINQFLICGERTCGNRKIYDNSATANALQLCNRVQQQPGAAAAVLRTIYTMCTTRTIV